MAKKECDLLIVGGGPAGLCAAINAASEGLRVCLLDSGMTFGGRARESHAIENYPMPLGFPNGATGADLMQGFIQQARKFRTEMHCPELAIRLRREANWLSVICDDFTEYASRAVLLTVGLAYRRFTTEGAASLMGRGVFYGLTDARASCYEGRTAAIVGGANSAGQAALRLARNPKVNVKVLTRSPLAKRMSRYLVDRIEAAPNVQVLEGVTVDKLEGNARLENARLSNGQSLPLSFLHIFIGAVPRTQWISDCVTLNERHYIETGGNGRLAYETSLPGVFACGDVRSKSTKRIAAAIGEGVGALQSIHSFMRGAA